MAPASKEGVTVADKEYLLGNKARELLKYTNQATKTVAEDMFNALSDEQKAELHCTGFSELDSMMAQWLV